MNSQLREEEQLLRDSVRRFLAGRCSVEQLAALEDSSDGYDVAGWGQLGEMGVVALPVAEALGGSGGTLRDAAAVAEELGRSAWPSPYLSNCSALLALQAVGDQFAEAITAVVADASVMTLVDAAGFVAEQRGDRWVLNGDSAIVPWGQCAVQFVCTAPGPDGADVVACVDAGQAGVRIEHRPVFDNERVALVSFDGVEVAAHAACLDLASAGRRAVAQSKVLWASSMVGGSKEVLEFTTAYMGERRQFGKTLSTFQAVRHACADAAMAIDAAGLMVADALSQIGRGHAATGLAATAAYLAGRAYVETVTTAAQLHGGVGVTTEHVLQQHFRRAKAMSLRTGAERVQLEAVASALLDRRQLSIMAPVS